MARCALVFGKEGNQPEPEVRRFLNQLAQAVRPLPHADNHHVVRPRELPPDQPHHLPELPAKQDQQNPRKEAEHRINHFIRVPQVRLVGENVEVGIYDTQVALKMAQEQALDLVEISPTVDPPVCKIIDYNKFLYDKKKKEKEMKAKSKVSEVKEIRFTPNTDDHDCDFKAKHAEGFLKDGNKVKAYVQFKGRAIQFQDRGQLLLLKLAERLAEIGVLENMPKMEGRRMLAMFAPKGKKKG